MKIKSRKQFLFFGEERFTIKDDTLMAVPEIDLGKELKNVKYLIMEFSGGGIKGVMSVYKAAVYEEKYGSIINKKIKKIWGCSTGGIIAAMWVLGKYQEIKSFINKWTFKDILHWYIERGPIVFKDRFLGGGLGSLYSDKEINKLFKNNFKELTFKQLYDVTKIDLNLRVVNVSKNRPEIWNYKNTPNYKVWAGVRATMGAPVYFPVFKYKGDTLTDGGVGMYACNAVPAYRDAISMKLNTDDFFLLSFGTGRKKVGKFGKNKISQIKWFLDYSQQESSSEQERKLIKYKKRYGLKYHRWNINLSDDLVAMDKTDNINELIFLVDK